MIVHDFFWKYLNLNSKESYGKLANKAASEPGSTPTSKPPLGPPASIGLTEEQLKEKEKVSKQDVLLIEVRERCTTVCENERVLLEMLDIRQEEARLAAERVEQISASHPV